MTVPACKQDIREDFPFLTRRVNGCGIVYLDNAATTQKPRAVQDAIRSVYDSGVANVHRATNFLAEEVTAAFEDARSTICRFIGAHAREVVLTTGSTHGINLIANSLGRGKRLRILTSTLEHHSNLLPWTTRATVDYVPWNASSGVDLQALAPKLDEKPDLVTLGYASNFLGTINPVTEIIRLAHGRGIPVLLDASQAIAHMEVDVRKLGCDYLVFSGHKVYGPAGTGVLYIRNDHLDSVEPVFVGGGMVQTVHAGEHVPNDVPYRFEAGTPNIEGVIGLAAAITYTSEIGFSAIRAHESALTQFAKQALGNIPGVRVFGPPAGALSAPIVAFQVRGLESNAVANALGRRANIVVRSGFHCAQPAHEELGLQPTVRASFAIYNTQGEVELLARAIERLARFIE